MKILILLIYLLPLIVLGQGGFHYNNLEMLNYAKSVKCLEMKTCYPGEYSYGSRKSTVAETILFDSINYEIKLYTRRETSEDTIAYPDIREYISQHAPDSTFFDDDGYPTELFVVKKSNYFRTKVKDPSGKLIYDAIIPQGGHPLYLEMETERLEFNELGKPVSRLIFKIFGKCEWDYYFDTAFYMQYNYLNDGLELKSWKKENNNDYSVKQNAIKSGVKVSKALFFETVSLSEYDWQRPELKLYFGDTDISNLKKTVYRTFRKYNYYSLDNTDARDFLTECFRYVDSASGKELWYNLPESRHTDFQNGYFGLQKKKKLMSGYRLLNYRYSEDTLMLVEVIELDEYNRTTLYCNRGFQYNQITKRFQTTDMLLHNPWGWRKEKYTYFSDEWPLRTIYDYRYSKVNESHPERMVFRKGHTINDAERWFSYCEVIDNTHFSLPAKGNMSPVSVEIRTK